MTFFINFWFLIGGTHYQKKVKNCQPYGNSDCFH